MNIIWPWAARKVIDAHKLDADRLDAMNSRLERKLKESELHQRILRTELERLQDLLKKAHFRNPKTGRIGRKGERFK
jgi:regulator of sirC expression with transglutaminase-like and TPR domain